MRDQIEANEATAKAEKAAEEAQNGDNDAEKNITAFQKYANHAKEVAAKAEEQDREIADEAAAKAKKAAELAATQYETANDIATAYVKTLATFDNAAAKTALVASAAA